MLKDVVTELISKGIHVVLITTDESLCSAFEPKKDRVTCVPVVERKRKDTIHIKEVYRIMDVIRASSEKYPGGVIVIDFLRRYADLYPDLLEDVCTSLTDLIIESIHKGMKFIVTIPDAKPCVMMKHEIMHEVFSEPVGKICSSMDHEIRRGIIQYLNEVGEASYTDMLEYLGIEVSSRFAFHLKFLVDSGVVTKISGDKYVLTDLGKYVASILEQIESMIASKPESPIVFI